MNAKETMQLLRNLGACSPAREWAKGKDLAEIWTTCKRGDWLLWLVGRMVGREGWPDRTAIVLVACDCAELALPFVPQGEDRPRIAIETARKWVRGEATIEEVSQARAAAAADAAAAYAAAAYAAADAAAAYAAAAYAAAAAAAAAAYAAAAAAAAAADADAAAAYAAAAADAADAQKNMQQKCLGLIREKLKPQCLLTNHTKETK